VTNEANDARGAFDERAAHFRELGLVFEEPL
jgi:hypothetical protein